MLHIGFSDIIVGVLSILGSSHIIPEEISLHILDKLVNAFFPCIDELVWMIICCLLAMILFKTILMYITVLLNYHCLFAQLWDFSTSIDVYHHHVLLLKVFMGWFVQEDFSKLALNLQEIWSLGFLPLRTWWHTKMIWRQETGLSVEMWRSIF